MKSALYILLILSTVGCSGILPYRSFEDQMDRNDDPLFVPGEDFPVVGGDSGVQYRSREEIRDRTPMFDRDFKTDTENKYLKDELLRKEQALTLAEMSLYREVEPYLQNSSEKIYFVGLSLPEKLEYANSRSIRVESNDYLPTGPKREKEILNDDAAAGRAIASVSPTRTGQEDLFLGMSKYEVSSSWGRPSEVEVAGNPMNQNERWVYRENGQVRYIYFEAGYLQGWESN